MTVTGSETRGGLRRTVHLTVSPDQPPIPMAWRPASAPRRSPRERVLLVAERAVGGLAPTLRTALLLVSCALVGLAIVGVFAGPLPAALSALILGVVGVLRRR